MLTALVFGGLAASAPIRILDAPISVSAVSREALETLPGRNTVAWENLRLVSEYQARPLDAPPRLRGAALPGGIPVPSGGLYEGSMSLRLEGAALPDLERIEVLRSGLETQIGSAYTNSVVSLLQGPLRAFRAEPPTLDLLIEPWHTPTLSTSVRTYGYHYFGIEARYDLFRDGVKIGGREPYTPIGYLAIPQPVPLSGEQTFRTGFGTLLEREGTVLTGMLPASAAPRYPPALAPLLRSGVEISGYALTENEDFDRLGPGWGVDLNQVRLEVPSLGSARAKLRYLPGLMLQPENANYQAMCVCEEAQPDDCGSLTLEAHCAQMALKEPDESVRFALRPGRDPWLKVLASLAERSMFRGPWDQARTWIYTDRATYAELRERLTPPPSPGAYVKALWEVSRLTGTDFAKGLYSPCVSADLIEGFDAPEEAAEWLVGHLARTKTDELVEATRYPEALLAALEGASSASAIAHLGRVAGAMLRNPDRSVRRAALDLLMLPKTARPGLEKTGVLTEVWAVWAGPDPSLAESAARVLATYGASVPPQRVQELPR